ncbi:substrate-binding domain-containing protein [Jannaschia sp. S6380]|uniref:substrate-binding domain-containing protein n=1 Tax=Jannaschia sp. S6380 TaxID=2926408 RepID=UPI001FF646AE|nr:substrate-binding domain-containing protein [Jannaschia sp. S6380]MCK0168102.1 substrate-binding domain-containing protein [Jannaschia sp. S6380]
MQGRLDITPSRPRRVRIADVAAEIGITKGTVSRALNGHPDIADGTRARVRRVAQRMGYVPLGTAQAIRTGRCRAIGLVLETEEHDAHRPFLTDFLAGLSQGAAAEAWTLTVATAPLGASLDTYRRLLDERKVDGFVLPRTRRDDPRVAMLRAVDTPFVLFGGHGDPDGCAWFDVDGAAAMRAAAILLARRGHRRIAYVGGHPDYTYSALREEGLRDGMRSAGLDLPEAMIRRGALDRADGAAAAGSLLDAATPPTALVYALDRAALGAWRAARDRGLVIGRDLAVLGYDGDPEGLHAEPPLATWAVDWHRAGARLADLLIRRVRGEPPETLRETMPATFLDRGSASCGAGASPNADRGAAAAESPESTGRNDS